MYPFSINILSQNDRFVNDFEIKILFQYNSLLRVQGEFIPHTADLIEKAIFNRFYHLFFELYHILISNSIDFRILASQSRRRRVYHPQLVATYHQCVSIVYHQVAEEYTFGDDIHAEA